MKLQNICRSLRWVETVTEVFKECPLPGGLEARSEGRGVQPGWDPALPVAPPGSCVQTAPAAAGTGGREGSRGHGRPGLIPCTVVIRAHRARFLSKSWPAVLSEKTPYTWICGGRHRRTHPCSSPHRDRQLPLCCPVGAVPCTGEGVRAVPGAEQEGWSSLLLARLASAKACSLLEAPRAASLPLCSDP